MTGYKTCQQKYLPFCPQKCCSVYEIRLLRISFRLAHKLWAQTIKSNNSDLCLGSFLLLLLLLNRIYGDTQIFTKTIENDVVKSIFFFRKVWQTKSKLCFLMWAWLPLKAPTNAKSQGKAPFLRQHIRPKDCESQVSHTFRKSAEYENLSINSLCKIEQDYSLKSAIVKKALKHKS